MFILERVISLLIGYAIGCIQTAYYVGKLNGIDIRDHGSKNAGMTNVTRTLGKKAGAFVFLVDILKCFAAFFIASLIFSGESSFTSLENLLPGLYAGFGAVLGHCFPVLLKFRGGRGVSCALALILLLDWHIALIAFGIGVISVATTRYISLASLAITLTTVILMIVFKRDPEVIAVTSLIVALIWFLHRGNIKRIITRTERKFLEKSK
ncbi:MAG: glycerol-3-phosphate 1-O-acyltransferase PlsY [Clostridiales bacterium]|jgi:glycerol-3-phosphate acyltransferase PlsY|nr:glycerol-3-phosphate 1-O-acyltransferase PlsY [Clostridiales bacterium]